MKNKGLGELAPLGCITVSDVCWYFYYLLDTGILVELEVELDTDARRFSRRVSSVVHDLVQVEQFLAS